MTSSRRAGATPEPGRHAVVCRDPPALIRRPSVCAGHPRIVPVQIGAPHDPAAPPPLRAQGPCGDTAAHGGRRHTQVRRCLAYRKQRSGQELDGPTHGRVWLRHGTDSLRYRGMYSGHPAGRPVPPPHCDTSRPQRASARWHISADTTYTAAVASAMVVGRRGHAGDTALAPQQGRPEQRHSVASELRSWRWMGVLPSPPVPNRRETGARQCTPWPVSPVAPCSQGGHKGGRHMDGGLAPLTPSVPLASIPSTSTGLSVHAASEEALTVIYHSARAHLCQDLYRHVGYNSCPLALLHRCLDEGKDVSLTLVRVTRQAVTSTVPDTWQHHVEGVARRGITPLPGRPREAIIVHRTCG